LIRPPDRHLDSDELDALVASQASGVPVFGRLSEDAVQEAQRHVESCENCDRKVQMHRSAQSAISLRVMSCQVAEGPNCSDETEWVKVAAGLLDETQAKERMNHAAQCGHCGRLLRNAVETLSDEATPYEEEVLASLTSARPEWHREMSRTLQSAIQERQLRDDRNAWWRGMFAWPKPVFAFAGIAAVAAFAWVGLRTLRPPSAEQLLAQAYTEHRTLEVRIPGAKYAPMRVERGVGTSNLDKSPSLLKAEFLISEHLSQHPNDPEWLDARARADLLDGNYESAIKSLQRALEAQPDSPGLLTDLGSAYFLRAESGDRPIDYGNAVESLGKVLAKSPDDLVALFNHALACERVFLYTQAVDDWQHYLRLDPQGDWSNDARNHLAALQEKLKQRESSQAEPLLSPEQIAGADAEDGEVRTKIDGRVESYLNIAVTDWLPRAYPVSQGTSTDAPVVRAALNTLAQIASQNHRDNWLRDLLSAAESPQTQVAVVDLAAAVIANDRADTGNAQQRAIAAARIFSSSGNIAGSLRARLEYLAATNISQDGTRCLKAASDIEREANRRHYPWILSQFHSEKGDCLFLLEDLGAAHREYLSATMGAEGSGYRALILRTQDHISVLDGASGDFPSGWRTASHGLASFWTGSYPNVRGYNLYYAIYELSRARRQPHLQVSAWRDGVALGETSPDIAQKAVAHVLMATAAITADAPQVAEQEFARASQLFAMSPQIESTRIAAVESEARLAGVENTQGKTEQAIARLRPLQSEIEQLSDNFLAILFYSTLGEAESRQGEDESAQSSLESAIALAEFQLSSLRDDKSRIDWDEQSSGAYRSLVGLRLRRGDALAALEVWEWYRGAVLRSGRLSNTGADSKSALPAHEVEHWVPSLAKETIVSYALLPGGLATWVYDDRGVTSQWTKLLPDELEAKILDFRTLCSTPDSDQSILRQHSRALYELLVSPIAPRLSFDRTLVIELDDHLAGVPFEALLDNQNRYLGERLPIVYSLGIYYRSHARTSTPITADTTALVASVPVSSFPTDPPVPSLPDSISEGEMVARSFRSTSLLLGQEASKGAILSRLPGTSVFHFAGHAFGSPRQSGLLLFDGLLTASELNRQELSGLQLAVFSGCDTQDGSEGAVTDTDSLVRTFLRAGVPHVVATRWNVDSRSARQLMSSFYRGLLTGNSIAYSIRQAQSDVRSSPGMAHPYYWSAFNAFGAM
jgi:CHAT domain-containing protein